MDKTSQRILMISAQFMPEVFGGAEHQCLKLSKQLASDGYEITVLTSRSTFKLSFEECMEGMHIVRIWTGGPPQVMGKYILSSFIWFIGCTLWFKRYHKKI